MNDLLEDSPKSCFIFRCPITALHGLPTRLSSRGDGEALAYQFLLWPSPSSYQVPALLNHIHLLGSWIEEQRKLEVENPRVG